MIEDFIELPDEAFYSLIEEYEAYTNYLESDASHSY
jgi:hypothetical protein